MRTYFYLFFVFFPLHLYAQTSYKFSGATAAVIRSYNLNDLEGVDIQLGSTDGSRSAATIASDMAKLGIWNYRDADFLTPPDAFPSALDSKFEAVSCPSGETVVNHVTLLVSSPNSAGTANLNGDGEYPLANRLAEAQDLNRSRCAGMVSAIEGPNEINNFPVEYGGDGIGCVDFFFSGGPVSGCTGAGELRAAEKIQQAIYGFVHHHMAAVRTDYFTGYGQTMANGGPAIPAGDNPSTSSGYADYDNAHPYPQNGSPPNYWTNRYAEIWAMNNEDDGYTSPPYMSGTQPPSGQQPFVKTVNQPAVTTEGGYSIGTAGLCDQNGVVTADIAGKQTLMDWLDGVLQGYTHVFIYKLINDDSSGFGFFDRSNNATAEATDTYRMNQIIQDNGAKAKTFSLYHLSWTAAATASWPVYSETIERSNGDYFVAFWQEAQICDNSTHRQVAAPRVAVRFSAGGTAKRIAVYDPTAAKPETPVDEVDGSSLTFDITDHPVFFEVDK